MKLFKNTNYSEEEMEKANILDAYTSQLKGERLSRRQKKLLQSYSYEDEMERLKQVVDFAHQQSDATPEYTLPRPGVEKRVEMALISSIRSNGKRKPDTVFGAELQMASYQQVGGDSEIEQLEYDYEIVGPHAQTGPESPRIKFEVIEGDETGKEYTLQIEEVILGRGKDVALKLEDDKISRLHSRLEAHAGILYITDLGSSNGTYVNDQEITKSTKLESGSKLKIGNLSLLVYSIESDEQGKFSVILREPDIDKEYNVTFKEDTIGRGANARIPLIDSTGKMSRIHARLQLRGNDVYIIDLDSGNGTYVEGQRVTASKLNVGADVKLGGVVIRILSIDVQNYSSQEDSTH